MVSKSLSVHGWLLLGMKSSGEVWTWQCGRCAAEFKSKAELDAHMTFCGKTPSL